MGTTKLFSLLLTPTFIFTEFIGKRLKDILEEISCRFFGRMIGGTIPKWLIVCQLYGESTNRNIDGFLHKFTTFFDILSQVNIGLNILLNNGLKEGKVDLLVLISIRYHKRRKLIRWKLCTIEGISILLIKCVLPRELLSKPFQNNMVYNSVWMIYSLYSFT